MGRELAHFRAQRRLAGVVVRVVCVFRNQKMVCAKRTGGTSVMSHAHCLSQPPIPKLFLKFAEPKSKTNINHTTQKCTKDACHNAQYEGR